MIAALYVIGGVLELTGIGLVARDVRDAHRKCDDTPYATEDARASREPDAQ
jgi:hypothetical protein